jgi:hypothetical protein
MRKLHGVTGAPDDRAQARAGEEQQARNREQDAEDRGAGRPEADRHDRLERLADGAAVRLAEGEQQSGHRHRKPELERADVDELAARDDERTERYEHDRCQVRRSPDGVGDEVTDRAPAESEPENRSEEHAQADQGEPDELRMMMRPRPATPARPLLHAAGRLWGHLVDPPFARHPRALLAPGRQSCRENEAVSIPKYVGAS